MSGKALSFRSVRFCFMLFCFFKSHHIKIVFYFNVKSTKLFCRPLRDQLPCLFMFYYVCLQGEEDTKLHHIDFTSKFSSNWEYVHFIFLSAARRRFGGPAAIAQVFQGDVSEHDSMHLYFFRVSRWSSTTFKKKTTTKRVQLKKKQGSNRFPLDSKRRSDLIRRTEDAWKVKQSVRKKPLVSWSLISVLPPVWCGRYSCISSLVFFLYPSALLFFLIQLILLYLFHYIVMCCFVELRRALCLRK